MYDINGDGKHDYKDSAIHHELSNSLEKGPTHQGGKVSYSEWVKKKNQEHRQGGKMDLGGILALTGMILIIGYFIIKIIFY